MSELVMEKNPVQDRINLLEMDYAALENWLVNDLKQPRFRAAQLWQWIWQKLEMDFSAMSNVSRELREILTEKACIKLPEIVSTSTGKDGTTKFLLEFNDGARVETVLIPALNRVGETRWSQCLSTQVGCPMQCTFCATGQMGFRRNMSMGEILGQVFIGKQWLKDLRPDRPVLRNLVFMGMGEPLLNLQSLIPALQVLGDERGANFSPRRITVSTCGLEKGLEKLGESGLAYLAVSLHAPNQKLREKIMPHAARWDLDKMLAALSAYPLKTRERITFEYLLLGGVNDSLEHAKQLAHILSHIKAKLNLIVYNPVPGLPFKAPEAETVEAFQKYLCDRHITAILRKSRGGDIEAACGQLATPYDDAGKEGSGQEQSTNSTASEQ